MRYTGQDMLWLIGSLSRIFHIPFNPALSATPPSLKASALMRPKKLGIHHQRTIPGCPWQNGRIERLFGILKQKLDQWQVANIAQLNADLNIFSHWYNQIRPHQNLNGRTPAEAWSGINPYTNQPKQEHWFEAWDGLLTGYCLKY